MTKTKDAPQSIDMRAYCGWRGNTDDDIVTKGTIYQDTSLKETRNGKRIYKDCYRAEIMICGERHRHRSKSLQDCEDWLKAVCGGQIKPTDNKADWFRMVQLKDEDACVDEIITSRAEEHLMLFEYHQTGDIKPINEYVLGRLIPHMEYYCLQTLHLGRKTTVTATRQTIGLILLRITSGRPVNGLTDTCKRMLRYYKKHGDFFVYAQASEPIKMVCDKINIEQLEKLKNTWKVTKDRRL